MVEGMSGDKDLRVWRMARSSGGGLNPAEYASRATSFAAAAGQCQPVTLLVVRDEGGLQGFMVAPARSSSEAAAMHLAQAVGARSTPESVMPELDTSGLGWLAYSPGSVASRETTIGADPAEAARRLSVALAPGQWVSVTIRPPSHTEQRRHRKWLAVRTGVPSPTHHSVTTSAVVMQVVAGGGSRSEVDSLLMQVAAAMPGFDVAVVARHEQRVAAFGVLLVAGLGAWAGARWGLDQATAGSAVGSGLVLLSGLVGTGRIPVAGSRLVARVAAGTFPPPPHRTWPPRGARKKLVDAETREVTTIEGDYPLADSAFVVGATVVAGLVSPSAGAMSGESQTEQRPTPSALRERVGPYIGRGADGARVHLPAADLWSGAAIFGRAGSGKSQIVRSLFGWSCLERVRPSGNPGWPGRESTLVAFESKGDGAAMYRRWAQATGDQVVVVDVANPQSPAIDLFDVPGSVAQRAQFFVSAMMYAFEPGSIQDRSADTLRRVLSAALVITPAMVAQVPDLDPDASPMYLAGVLCGSHGDEAAALLAGTLISEVVRLETLHAATADQVEARTQLAPLFGSKVTAAQRRTLTEAPANKLAQLVALEHWWRPGRAKVSWSQIIDEHRAVVVNTGVAESGQIIDSTLTSRMSALLMFGLRDAIMRTCSGWEEMGRSVSIFADELSLLAGSSPEVITWLRNQGRSYGVHAILATQYADQLDNQVRTAVTGFGTVVAFAQDSPKVAEDLARDFGADGSAWSGADVVNLPEFTAIIRTTHRRTRQSVFTVRAEHFEGDMAGFARAQAGTDD